jgi:pyruvate/2-oxoglutarate dehydrogenase complex dihydrolipoamide dehydrogenase (E3) component
VISGRLSVRVGSTVGLQRRTFYLGNATADAKNPAEVEKKQTKFDLAVIGGGSGGMSCAASAAKLGKSVVLFDHVSPSLQGSAWGVGGTCVNVGCIPKKLMHQASLFRDAVDDAADFGWDVQATHNWATLRGNIQTHIRGINFGYHAKMKKDGVTYVNERANLSSDVTVESVNGYGCVLSWVLYSCVEWYTCT